MKHQDIFLLTLPFSRTSATLFAALLLTGCSNDYVSYDDMRTQNTAEERFPITVVDQPVNMSVAARQQTLAPDQVNGIIGFAREAESRGASSLSIVYPSRNRYGRSVATQAAKLVAKQGVQRANVTTSVYNGTSDYVTLSYYSKVARTKNCGDWSENLAGNQFNQLYPNYGCAIQNNFAVMAENPEDFEGPRGLAPAIGGSRSAVLKKYNSGDWSQKQQEFPDATTTQAAP